MTVPSKQLTTSFSSSPEKNTTKKSLNKNNAVCRFVTAGKQLDIIPAKPDTNQSTERLIRLTKIFLERLWSPEIFV